MATITRRLSLEEFLAIPDFDERRLELIDGEVFEEMSPNWIHTKVAGVLISCAHLRQLVAVTVRAPLS